MGIDKTPGDAAAGRRGAVAGVIAAMVIFAGNYVGARHGVRAGMGLADLLGARYAVCGPILALAFLRVPWPPLGRACVIAALGGAPYFLITLVGLQYAPASHAVVLNPGGAIVTTFALSWMVFGRRPRPAAMAGVVMVLAGLVAIAWDGLLLPGRRVWLGDLLLAASGVQWGCFMILLQRWRVPGVSATAAVSVLSIPPVVLWMLWAGSPLDRAPLGEVAFQALYQGVLVGVIGFTLFNRCVALLGATTTALFPPLVPVLGTIMSAAFLGERITTVQIVGIAVVIAGMLVGAVLGPAGGNLRRFPNRAQRPPVTRE